MLLVKSGGVSSSGDTKKWAGVEIVNGSGCSIQKNEVLCALFYNPVWSKSQIDIFSGCSRPRGGIALSLSTSAYLSPEEISCFRGNRRFPPGTGRQKHATGHPTTHSTQRPHKIHKKSSGAKKFRCRRTSEYFRLDTSVNNHQNKQKADQKSSNRTMATDHQKKEPRCRQGWPRK